MRLCREHRGEDEEREVGVEERRAERVLFGAGGQEFGVGARDNSAKKERKKTPPKHSRAGGGAGCSQITPQREKEEGRACDCAALLVVACLKERECIVFQPVNQSASQSFKQTVKWNNFD